VVQVRTPLLLAGAIIPALALPVLLFACFSLGDGDPSPGWPALLLGLLMLAVAWPLLRRSTLPLLATLTPHSLRLEPRDRSLAYGVAPRDVALHEFTGYGELYARGGGHIKLYRAHAPKLQLADRPKRGIPEAEAHLPGLVDALTLGRALQAKLTQAGVPAERLHRPNFYQGGAGRALAWLCYALLGLAGVLLLLPGVPWTVPLRLFTFTALYLGLYRRNQRPSEPAAPKTK
jgi:hypothetical protein